MNYIKAIDENRTSINRVNMAYLQKKHNAKLKTKLEIYEKILNRIYNRIDIASNVDNTLCVFDIPEYIYGFPIYNIPACADYLTRKLIHNGFHVKFIKPNILYISWKYNSSINCISPLMNVPYTPEIAYPDAMEPKQTSLHALPEPPLPDYDKPAVKNIPLPPMNFQYTGNHEMLSLMPPPNRAPNGSSYEPKTYEIPQPRPSPQPQPRQISYDQPSQQYKQFQISLSERPEPKSKSQKNYKSTEEYRPSGKFLYHNHK